MTADAHYLTCYARAIKFVKSGSDESTPVLFKKQEKTKGADPTGLREHKDDRIFQIVSRFFEMQEATSYKNGQVSNNSGRQPHISNDCYACRPRNGKRGMITQLQEPQHEPLNQKVPIL